MTKNDKILDTFDNKTKGLGILLISIKKNG